MVHRSEVLHATHFHRHYHRALPVLKLAPFVESFWRLDSYRALPMGVAEHFVPGLASRLVFPFANRCEYLLPGQLPQPICGPHLVPPQAQPLACLHPSSQGILGITLTPGGLVALGVQRDSEGILRLPEWQNWEVELANCESFEQACQALTAALSERLCPTTEGDILAKALSKLEAENAIAETAAELGLSARSLQRLFLQTVGYSPRTCQRVMRLRRTLQGIWQNPERRVWDSDYCDYSHFFKEFKALMGKSPTVYLQQFTHSQV